MNKELQRTTIAKVCGWEAGEANVNRDHSKAQGFWYKQMFYVGTDSLPDYLNDLNEMHEALKFLVTDDQKRRFVDYISNINNGGNGALRWRGRWACASASAAQYAEAFLRVFNLWID